MTFGVKLLGAAESKYSILAVLQNTGDPECITVKLCNRTGLTNRTDPNLSIGFSLVDDGQRVSADHQLSHLAVGAHLAPGVVLYGAGQREHCGEESVTDGQYTLSDSKKTNTDPESEHPAQTRKDAPHRGPGPVRGYYWQVVRWRPEHRC